MRKYIVYILLLINYSILLNDLSAQPIKKDYSRKVDSLLQQMTLEEKVGQMIQYSNDKLQTGPTIKNQNHVEEIKKGMVGSMFNIITVSGFGYAITPQDSFDIWFGCCAWDEDYLPYSIRRSCQF